jgi:catechol 2,3-dioxygenase-like lactoylglutathione lyase family enzyme
MIQTEGLTHIHLLVRDLERSLNFYKHVFGLEEQFWDGPSMVFLRTPGRRDTITLKHEPGEQALTGVCAGIAHFGFRLVDRGSLEAAISEVVSAGGKLVERGVHPSKQPFAYVTDPDGYVIEL